MPGMRGIPEWRSSFIAATFPPTFRSGPVVAIDTETMGLNPHRDRLCLVQLSAGDGNAHLVQIPRGPDQGAAAGGAAGRSRRC